MCELNTLDLAIRKQDTCLYKVSLKVQFCHSLVKTIKTGL